MTKQEQILELIKQSVEELNLNGKEFDFYCVFSPITSIFEIGIGDEELDPVVPFGLVSWVKRKEQIEDFVLQIRSREFYERELEKFWSRKESEEMQNKGEK